MTSHEGIPPSDALASSLPKGKKPKLQSNDAAIRTFPPRILLLLLLLVTFPAHAHVGSKDVFEQIAAGPYQLFVTIRPPVVIPGVASIEVRTSGPSVRAISITPVPLTGEAANHPPTPDTLHASADDPTFFTGSLWLMAQGSWQVRFGVDGGDGKQTTSVPVPAMPLSILPMQRSLGITLAMLGLFLVLSMTGIVAAAVREARLPPGTEPDRARRRRALLSTFAALAVMSLLVYAGDHWWNVEAAGYSLAVYHPLGLRTTLTGNVLDLSISAYDDLRNPSRSRSNGDLLSDHGHIMHLYAIRQPGMDAAFHLHPELTAPGHLRTTLPSMPPGTYNLYGDIVHSNGFPETLVATLNVPAGLPAKPLAPEDASAFPEPLSWTPEDPNSIRGQLQTQVGVQGDILGPVYKLPDHYTMTWDAPANITAHAAYTFRFHLLDPGGHPVKDMQPYLGMAGHAAFVKDDGSTFAHTHPEGSAAMQAVELANPGSMEMMQGASTSSQRVSTTVDFPYGFPSAGRYRIFVQMKHGATVETGVFDAAVKPQS